MRQSDKRGVVAGLAGLLVFLEVVCFAGPTGVADSVGWRGNWTGRYPDAEAPTEWGRINRGVTSVTFCSAAKPAGPQKAGQPLDKGLIRDWLVIGPFPVEDSVGDFDKEQIPGEDALGPKEGDEVGDLTWRRLELEKQLDYVRWGTTELERLDIDKAFGKTPNHIVYAHTYLYCEHPGKAWFVVDHHFGFKLWVNGVQVYSKAQNAGGLGNYVGISKQKKALVHHRSPKVEIELKQGWNRLLVKVSTYNREGWWGFGFAQRLVDVEPVPYDEKNIVWVTKLPERTNGSPIIVGDRVFTTADPDVLVCLDKKTGRILWKRLNTYYHATPQNERAADPVFREKIAPLVAELEKTDDEDRNLELRREIHKLLVEIDKEKYDPKWDGHFESHFGIMGFSTTPVSDGKNVYVFFGHGVSASYDLDGNRRWIRRIVPKQLAYTCSPAVVGDVFVVFMEKMIAYRKDTGETVWEQPGVQGSIASLIPARIGGVDVVVSQKGEVLRAADGKILWVKEGKSPSWTASAVLGDVLYLPWYDLRIVDFSNVEGDAWKPVERGVGADMNHRRADGQWLDRPSCGSPLIHDGYYYLVDIYGVFYAVNLETRKTTCRKDLGFDELHSYNHVGVAASPALAGSHVYVMDNQGECVVMELGPDCKEVARNRIETLLQRDWPMPPQEVTNATPVFDGKHVFIRGEQYLYCIGGK